MPRRKSPPLDLRIREWPVLFVRIYGWSRREEETDLDLETFFFFFLSWKPSETVGHRANANFRVGGKRGQRQTEEKERERGSAWPRDDINPRLLNGFMSQKRGMEVGEKENKERRVKEKEKEKSKKREFLLVVFLRQTLVERDDATVANRIKPLEMFRFLVNSQPTRTVDIR